MKICEFLSPERIVLDIVCRDKAESLQNAARLLAVSGVASDWQALYDGMAAREALMSTGVGNGIGIPHASGPFVIAPSAALLRLLSPVDFEAIDRRPVDLLIAVAVPEGDQRTHLSLLAGIARLCKNPQFLSAVHKAKDPGKLFNRIRNLEKEMAFH
ncbi:MAG: PTS sugar transporter subunit IIA [Thermodesulfobacteriota bacterium]